MTASPPADERVAEIAAGLERVRARIAAAAHAAGRSPAEITLVAVTKTFPAADVAVLAGLGVVDVGENRAQELAAKRPGAPAGLRWHFLGAIQRNKAKLVAAQADVVHSLDRPDLVELLDRHAADRPRPLEVLVQVSLDGDPARGGALPADVPGLAEAVAAAPRLLLRGVMAVAPLTADPAAAFAALADVAAVVQAAHPEATWVSAGMSADLEPAVRAGATHVRIGSALLGRRAPAVG